VLGFEKMEAKIGAKTDRNACVETLNHTHYRGTSLIRNTHPPRITTGP